MAASELLPRSFGTHNGMFHADEVTSCALLLLTDRIDREHILRSRDMNQLDKCEYLCDIGGLYAPEKKRFDHHQLDYQGGLSSAGMVLNYLQEEGAFTEIEANYLRNNLITGVDAIDNGFPTPIGFCTFSHVIGNMTPIVYDATPEEENACFFKAVDFTLSHLKRLLSRHDYCVECEAIIRDVMDRDSDCLFFDRAIPWQEGFFHLGGVDHPALFVIMPSGPHWKLRGVPPNPEKRMEVRLPLPEEWAGLMDEDLRRASGIPGAIFCHKGRFFSVWERREDALAALDYILEQEEKKHAKDTV